MIVNLWLMRIKSLNLLEVIYIFFVSREAVIRIINLASLINLGPTQLKATSKISIL